MVPSSLGRGSSRRQELAWGRDQPTQQPVAEAVHTGLLTPDGRVSHPKEALKGAKAGCQKGFTSAMHLRGVKKEERSKKKEVDNSPAFLKKEERGGRSFLV